MKPWESDSSSLRAFWPYLTSAAIAFGLAVMGYAAYLPSAGTLDVAFHAVNLLALNFHVVDGADVPWPLEVARFLVHGIAGAALGIAVTTFARRRIDRRRAAGWGEHIVVVGGAPTAVELAAAYRAITKRVVLVGALTTPDSERLRRTGVRVVAAPDDGSLHAVVREAKRVIVAGDGDHDSVRLATRVLSLPGTQDRRTHLLVEQPQLAAELRSSLPAGVDVCCISERVASAALQCFPPRHHDTLGPGPVVIGEGDLAVELARRMVRGWQRPAEAMEVFCLGPEPAEFKELQEELTTVGRVEVASAPWGTRTVVEQVAAHAVRGRPTDRDLERRGEHGPLVMLAGLGDATTFTLATKIASEVEGATVVALVDRAEGWSALATSSSIGRRAAGATLHVRAARSVISQPEVLETDQVRLLALELFADQRRWRGDVPSIFGRDMRAATDLDALSAAQRARFEAVAAAIPDAVGTAGLRIESTDQPRVLLLPEELVGIAAQLRRACGPAVGAGCDDYVWLEFVAQLPMLVSRAGTDLVRRAVPEVAIGDADVEAMARAAHEGYLETQKAVGNVTGSRLASTRWEDLTEFAKESNRAQVRDIPVKLAGVGRTLCPGGTDGPDRSWLTDETVQRLARWEHRRWEYLHRLAGYTFAEVTDHPARQHSQLVPWKELAATTALDTSAVTSIPDLLAAIGLDSRPIDPSHQDHAARPAVAGWVTP